MTTIHQTLKFGDLPIGTKFHHPKTDEVYYKSLHWPKPYNAHAHLQSTRPMYLTIHSDLSVKLTTSLDFYSIDLYAPFAYDNKVWTKIARNRAKTKGTDTTKYFEPDDSVSPL